MLAAHSQMTITDRLSEPDRLRKLRCREIAPHTRVRIVGDRNCFFRAFSRHLTGTEGNHAAVRQALLAHLRRKPHYMQCELRGVDRVMPTDRDARYYFCLEYATSKRKAMLEALQGGEPTSTSGCWQTCSMST